MQTNLKTWLETTGMKVADTAFKKPPGLPYIVFQDDASYRGSDESNTLAERNVKLELYSDVIDEIAEGLVEVLLDAKAYAFTKHREWISSESFYMTIYEFQTTERK